jgi:hypothetical protein
VKADLAAPRAGGINTDPIAGAGPPKTKGWLGGIEGILGIRTSALEEVRVQPGGAVIGVSHPHGNDGAGGCGEGGGDDDGGGNAVGVGEKSGQ